MLTQRGQERDFLGARLVFSDTSENWKRRAKPVFSKPYKESATVGGHCIHHSSCFCFSGEELRLSDWVSGAPQPPRDTAG